MLTVPSDKLLKRGINVVDYELEFNQIHAIVLISEMIGLMLAPPLAMHAH